MPLQGVEIGLLFAMTRAPAPAAATLAALSEKKHVPRRTTAMSPGASGFRSESPSQARPTHTKFPLTDPAPSGTLLPTNSTAGNVWGESGPLVTDTAVAVTVPAFPVWLAAKASPALVDTATAGVVFRFCIVRLLGGAG